MAVKFRIKAIGPKKIFNVSAGQAAREKALEDLAQDGLELFEKITNPWERKVIFVIRVNLAGENVSITTTDKIFGFVDIGTSVRYATMSPDFSPKTRVGVLSSSRGRGGMIFVNKNKPKPGIEAREFSVIIQERIQKKFVARFKEVLKEYESGEAPGL